MVPILLATVISAQLTTSILNLRLVHPGTLFVLYQANDAHVALAIADYCKLIICR